MRVHRIVAFVVAALAVSTPARAAGFVDTGGPSFDAVDHVRLNPANPLEAYAEATRGWFHTANGGASWVAAPTPTGTADVIFDPAGAPGRRIALVAGKLLASVDGSHWAPAGAPLPVGGLPHDLTMAAGAPQRRLLLVGQPTAGVVPAPALARALQARCRPQFPLPHVVAGRQRVLVSVDGGAHWSVGGVGLPPSSAVVGIALAADGATAYLVEASALDEASVWRSGDGGVHWTRIAALPTRRAVPVVAADATSPQRVYVAADRVGRCGGQEIYRSDDGGRHFVGLGAGLPPNTIADALATSRALPGRVVVQLHQDVYDAIAHGPLRGLAPIRRSDDGGVTWRNDGRGLADGEADGGVALAVDGSTWAATGWGVYRESRPDAGYHALAGLPGAATLAIAPDLARTGRLFAKTARGVWRSDDGGRTWRLLRETPQRGAALTAAGARNPVLFLTCSVCTGVRSLDGGATWKRLRLPRGTFSLAATPASRRRVFAETTAGWWRSDDAGAHWQAIPPAGLDRLALDPTDARVVWRFEVGTRRISRSLDGGRHFRALPAPRIRRGGAVTALLPLGGRRHAVLALVTDRRSALPSRALRRDDRTRRFTAVRGVDLRANCSVQVVVDPRRPAQVLLVDTPVVPGTLAPGPARFYASGNRGATWRGLGTSGALGLVVADATIAGGRAYLATQAGIYVRSPG